MTIPEFNKKLESAVNEVSHALPEIIDARALNSIQFMKDRFIQQGTKVDESGNEVSFPAYSEQYGKKKELRSGGTPNRLVLTGDMLRKLRIVERKQSGPIYTAVIGGGDKFAEDKLEWNTDHYGTILNLTKNEQQIITDLAEEEIVNVFKNALG